MSKEGRLCENPDGMPFAGSSSERNGISHSGAGGDASAGGTGDAAAGGDGCPADDSGGEGAAAGYTGSHGSWDGGLGRRGNLYCAGCGRQSPAVVIRTPFPRRCGIGHRTDGTGGISCGTSDLGGNRPPSGSGNNAGFRTGGTADCHSGRHAVGGHSDTGRVQRGGVGRRDTRGKGGCVRNFAGGDSLRRFHCANGKTGPGVERLVWPAGCPQQSVRRTGDGSGGVFLCVTGGGAGLFRRDRPQRLSG